MVTVLTVPWIFKGSMELKFIFKEMFLKMTKLSLRNLFIKNQMAEKLILLHEYTNLLN